MDAQLPLIDAVHAYVWPNVYKRTNSSGTSYLVQWKVAGKQKTRSHDDKRSAENFRDDLKRAIRNREGFDPVTKLPKSMTVDENPMTFLDLACEVVDRKWRGWSQNNRRSRVEALAQLCAVLVDNGRGKPDANLMRRWAQDHELPPESGRLPVKRTKIGDRLVDVAEQEKAADWMIEHSLPIAALSDTLVIDEALRAIATRPDGTPYAPDTQQRQRTSLSLVCDRAVELKLLAVNPVHNTRRDIDDESLEADPERVPSPKEARELVDAVCNVSEIARLQYRAYFTLLWTTGMRPSEASGIRLNAELVLPDSGHGSVTLRTPLVHPGKRWTGNGTAHAQRDRLKARKKKVSRRVIIPAEAVAELRRHIKENDVKNGELIFRNSNGKPIDPSSMGKVWRKARKVACGGQFDDKIREDGVEVPGLRVYDLRHTYCTMAIEAGIPIPRIAAQVGNSPATLMRVYARWTDDNDDAFVAKLEVVMHIEKVTKRNTEEDADDDE